MKNCKFIRWLPLSFFYYFDRIQDPVLLWHMGVLETIARSVGSDTSAAAAAIGTYTAHITEDMIKYPSSYFSPKKISKGLCNHWVRSCSYKYNEAKNFLKSYFIFLWDNFNKSFPALSLSKFDWWLISNFWCLNVLENNKEMLATHWFNRACQIFTNNFQMLVWSFVILVLLYTSK